MKKTPNKAPTSIKSNHQTLLRLDGDVHSYASENKRLLTNESERTRIAPSHLLLGEAIIKIDAAALLLLVRIARIIRLRSRRRQWRR